MRNLLYISLFTLLSISCSKEEKLSENADNHFFLENNGAIMPVQVSGNTSSKLFVIFLHGGPGDSAIQGFSSSGIFKNLEEDYAIVYFDQRCAGLSQGDCDPSSLQVSDYVDDIDKLITVIEDIYGNDISLFLMGHSWGATLGLDYLINGTQKQKIKGYVQSDGSHNIPKLFFEQKDILTHYANQQIGLGNNTDEWQNILDDITDADPTITEGRGVILNSTYMTEELFNNVDSVQLSSSSFTLRVFLGGIFPITANQNQNSDFTLSLFDYDITDQLSQISTPVAMYWGKFDLVHPPNMALDIFSNLESSEKELFFFSKSFHSPMANENELYQEKVKEFIETHR